MWLLMCSGLVSSYCGSFLFIAEFLVVCVAMVAGRWCSS